MSIDAAVESVSGEVANIIYYNKDNGFTVFVLKGDDTRVNCTGSLPELMIGDRINVRGSYVNNARYGKQLAVEYLEREAPKSEDAILRYLGSGVIKGIGERMAVRIVAKFGAQTLDIMDETPERLEEIRGISHERAISIGNIYHEQATLRRAMLFLQEFGVTPTYAMRIYKKFGEDTINVVKTNPYLLADDIHGIGFITADRIAARAGIPTDSEYRIKSGIKYVLNNSQQNGHVYLPKDILISEASELLRVPDDAAHIALTALSIEKSLVAEPMDNGCEAVYAKTFHEAETYIANKLYTLSHSTKETKATTVKEGGITLSPSQQKAVEDVLTSGVLVITGGPGTGKTTTINNIIKMLAGAGLSVELAAPTGRAAKRVSETTGADSKTIHRLLEIEFMSDDSKRQVFKRNEGNPIEADAVIIDESSMIDNMLMYHLLKAIAPGTRLILAGDVDQLPSVGAGNVLADIINSGVVTVTRLTEIFRQAAQSAIITNAHNINKGVYPVSRQTKDFFMMRRATPDDIVSTIIDLITRRLPSFLDAPARPCDPLVDIQVLCPMRKSIVGVDNLNRALQEKLNPPSFDKREKEYHSTVFREGDKVMQTRNNYNIAWRVVNERGQIEDSGSGIYNGDVGVIKKIDLDDEILIVRFDDGKVVEYNFSDMEDLELCYAATVHKSQGSEYRCVIIPIHSGPPMLMSRNLLYTAVTRARQLVVIVGSETAMNRMVDNNRVAKRYTSLAKRLTRVMAQQTQNNQNNNHQKGE